MKIGYPCINRSIGCTSNSTFRLANYSEQKLIEIVSSNLGCLSNILRFNVEHGLLFFRISSDIVPFASHPVCTFDWKTFFKKDFAAIGKFIKKHGFRISMHPDQFVLLSSPKQDITERSVSELAYHCQVLDLMGLDSTAKVQIHVGGVYGNKQEAMKRFVESYNSLDKQIKKRLVIENDDNLYSLRDCLQIHEQVGIPVLFDYYHHQLLNNGETARVAMEQAFATWKTNRDGVPMVDYSSAKPGGLRGAHADEIDLADFKRFLSVSRGLEFDLMLEIKDKEKSALKALKLLE